MKWKTKEIIINTTGAMTLYFHSVSPSTSIMSLQFSTSFSFCLSFMKRNTGFFQGGTGANHKAVCSSLNYCHMSLKSFLNEHRTKASGEFEGASRACLSHNLLCMSYQEEPSSCRPLESQVEMLTCLSVLLL